MWQFLRSTEVEFTACVWFKVRIWSKDTSKASFNMHITSVEKHHKTSLQTCRGERKQFLLKKGVQ